MKNLTVKMADLKLVDLALVAKMVEDMTLNLQTEIHDRIYPVLPVHSMVIDASDCDGNVSAYKLVSSSINSRDLAPVILGVSQNIGIENQTASISINKDLFALVVPQSLQDHNTTLKASHLLKSAKRGFVNITYRNFGEFNYEVHAMQLTNLLEVTKLLGLNTSASSKCSSMFLPSRTCTARRSSI